MLRVAGLEKKIQKVQRFVPLVLAYVLYSEYCITPSMYVCKEIQQIFDLLSMSVLRITTTTTTTASELDDDAELAVR